MGSEDNRHNAKIAMIIEAICMWAALSGSQDALKAPEEGWGHPHRRSREARRGTTPLQAGYDAIDAWLMPLVPDGIVKTSRLA